MSYPRRIRLAAAGACLALGACRATPAPAFTRPALPLPAATALAFALQAPVGAAVEVVGGDRSKLYWRGTLRCADDIATFHLLEPRGVTPRPLILCLPILAGGADLMWHVAAGLSRRGFSAAWVDRAGAAMTIGQRAVDLDLLFRRTVRHNRMLLRWAERRPDLFAPGQQGLLGISTGGIVGVAMLALEPDVPAGALCLAGADVPSLLLETAESRVARWRAWRAADDGLAGQALQAELERALGVDPLRFGAHVDARRVLLVHAGLDQVVPGRHHELLWESLGRPADFELPWLGHYSAALALDAILDAVAAFYRTRFAASAGSVAVVRPP